MFFALYTQVDQRELVEHGSGFFEIVILAVVLFLVALPFCALWAFFRRRPMKTAADNAAGFMLVGVKVATVVLAILPLCAIAVLLPFAILNIVGMAIFGKDYYWPFIGPCLVIFFALIGFGYWRVYRSNRPGEKKQEKSAI